MDNQKDFLTRELFESKMAFAIEALDGIRSSIDDLPDIRIKLERIDLSIAELKKDNIRLANLQTYHKEKLHKEIISMSEHNLSLDRELQQLKTDKKWIVFLFGLCWALFLIWFQDKR